MLKRILKNKSMQKTRIYKFVRKINPFKKEVNYPLLSVNNNPQEASDLIYNVLTETNPSMIARFGSTELTCFLNYLGVKDKDNGFLSYINGNLPFWWQPAILSQMQNWSGFFPPTIEKIEQFCELMQQDAKQIDVLGSWISSEYKVDHFFNYKKVHLRLLEPFWAANPWTTYLENKNVLVVHPFAELILRQYKNKREHLFSNKQVLPKFKSLTTIKAVQSLGEGDARFKDWFEALNFMKQQIDNVDYDVCLIGCGAYGLSLAAHVKRTGKKAVHLGGSLQLLFGIRGNRWDDPNYGVNEWGIPEGSYSNLVNEHWVRPGDNLKSKNASSVEGACYW